MSSVFIRGSNRDRMMMLTILVRDWVFYLLQEAKEQQTASRMSN